MNKARRNELEKALRFLDQAKEIVEQCHDEEQECFDNLSEGLQASDRGQQYQTNAENLECAVDEFDTIQSYIEEAMQ